MRPKGSLSSAITSSHLPEELSCNLNTNGSKLEWNYHVASSPNRQAPYDAALSHHTNRRQCLSALFADS